MISLISLLIVPIIGAIIILFVSSPAVQGYNNIQTISNTAETLSSPSSISSLEEYYEIIKNNTLDNIKIKKIALITSLINFFISIILWFQFDPNSSDYQFVNDFGSIISSSTNSEILNFCHFHIGVDGISLYFVLLTTFITPICILSNWTDITYKIKYFLCFIF